jgi:hypothetical protein
MGKWENGKMRKWVNATWYGSKFQANLGNITTKTQNRSPNPSPKERGFKIAVSKKL